MPTLSEAQIANELKSLPGWEYQDGSLRKLCRVRLATFRPPKLAGTMEGSLRSWTESRKYQVLALDNISKSFAGRIILDQVGWSVPDDARVSLVGLNGAGKSTLLKLIAGKLEPDSGRITRPQRSQIGYLEQDAPEMGGRTLLDETLAALADRRALDRRRL